MFSFPFRRTILSLAATKKKKQEHSWWTLIGTWVLMAAFTWITGGFELLFQIVIPFSTGELVKLQSYRETGSAPIISAAVVVLVPVLIAIVAFLSKLLPSDADKDINATRQPERRFAVCMAYLIGEEIVFRLIPLGFLIQIPVLHSELAFYLLLLAATSIFAVVHWITFSEEEQKLPVSTKLLLVLPQFIGGLFFSMVYVSHGFFTALMAHIIYDTVVFSAYNPQNRFKVLYLYHLMWLTVGLLYFLIGSNHSIGETWQLLTFQYDDLGKRDWNDKLVMSILFLSFYSLLLEILQYDHEKEKTRKLEGCTLLLYGAFLSLAYPAIQGMELLLPGHFEIKTVCMVILLVSFDKTRSSCGVARLVWKSLLISQLLIIMDGTNFLAMFMLIALFITYQAGVLLMLYSMHFFPIRYGVFVAKMDHWLKFRGRVDVAIEDVSFHMVDIHLMLKSLGQKFQSDPSSAIQEYEEIQTLLLSCIEKVLQEEKDDLTYEELELYTSLLFHMTQKKT